MGARIAVDRRTALPRGPGRQSPRRGMARRTLRRTDRAVTAGPGRRRRAASRAGLGTGERARPGMAAGAGLLRRPRPGAGDDAVRIRSTGPGRPAAAGSTARAARRLRLHPRSRSAGLAAALAGALWRRLRRTLPRPGRLAMARAGG